MFDERTFIAQKQNQWMDLTAIVMRVKALGLRRIPLGDLTRLGALYRRSAADLAYARTQRATPELIYYLNELVGDAHGLLYATDSHENIWKIIGNFLAYDLPDVLRRRMAFIAAAFLMTVAGGLLAYFLVRHDPSAESLFIPAGFQDSVEAWKHGFADKQDLAFGEGAQFSWFLMLHNFEVGIGAFGTGITLVIPFLLMLENGFMMGALVAVVQPTGYLGSMWPGLAPHGICELFAIFVCAGGGFLIGWSLINPGPYTRRDALIANGKDALKMLFGTVLLFIIAGILEGNVSHSSIPHWAKYSLAAVQFLALAFYIYGAPRRPTPATTSQQAP